MDDASNIYLTGYTHAADFPTTVDSYDPSYNGDAGNVFISLFSGGLGANLDLSVERKEARAFSIVRSYGQIQILIGTSAAPVAQYRIQRSRGGGDFVLLRAIIPAELQNNQYQMQDKYLEKDITYTYRVEAFDADGKRVGISSERSI